MTELAFRTASDLAAAIRRREISSREVLDHYLARIDRLNARLRAIVTLEAEGARSRADAADAAVARGESIGPLHGVPITIKDSLETEGMLTTAGSREYARHVPATDAPAVARLRAAGAIVFGKTNLPSLAMDVQSANALFGTTTNPWDETRSPGGSSGGSAAAVAAGLTGLELGSDLAGSVRLPAHACGVYGHKPSYGIVPVRGHVPGPPGTLATPDLLALGPIARGADDLEAALGAIAGPDEADARGWRLDLQPPRRGSMREYRIGVWLDDPACPVDAPVRERLEAAVDALAKAGAKVDRRARPDVSLADAWRDALRLMWGAISPMVDEKILDRLAEEARNLAAGDESLRARFARFAPQRHREWLAADEARERYRAAWAAFFREHDALLSPASPVPAIPHDTGTDPLTRTITVNGAPRPYWEQVFWATVVGMAFLPATVAPVGRTPAGLPVGIQIVGPYLEDRTPIDLARRMADVVGGFEPPPLFVGNLGEQE